VDGVVKEDGKGVKLGDFGVLYCECL